MVSLALKVLLLLWLLWLFYLAVMSLYRAHQAGTLSLAAQLLGYPILGYPILAIGAVLDAGVNLSIMSLVFLERPAEWLVTKRLARHMRDGSGWRHVLATWICRYLLNPFDPDQRGHCR